MILSDDFKKLISVSVWAIAIVAYLVVFIFSAVSIASFLGDIKIGNNFISNNQMFFAQLIGYWLTALILLLITLKKYRYLGYKLLLAVVILLTIINGLPSIGMWHSEYSLWYNFLWSVLVIAGLFAYLSIYLLAFSVLEYLFKVNLKKPILINKKILVALAVIAIVSLLITFGFSFVGLPHDWII